VTCERIVDSTQCTPAALTSAFLSLDCFWLYSGSEGDGGSCRSKSDTTLECENARRSGQCVTGDVTNLNSSCVWLDGNGTREIPSKCVLKVFEISIVIIFLIRNLFFFFFFLIRNYHVEINLMMRSVQVIQL
jgi:hypothetical protein